MMRGATFAFVLSLFALGCAPSAERDASDEAALGGAVVADARPLIHFRADGSVTTEGAIVSGRSVAIAYDEDRMPTCRGGFHGGPGWTVTGYFRVSGGEVRTFTAAGFSPTHDAADRTITLPPAMGTTDLELWFENTSVWGCQAWDSDYGRNFHFAAAAPPEAPAWMGDVRYAGTRATCDGAACEADRHPLVNDAFTFDDWTRQRAAVTILDFRVYKPGVTDWDNPGVWQALDVKAHYRARSSAAFRGMPVNTEKRVGNDERYAFDVRALDPFKPASMSGACPDADLVKDGDTVRVTVELYFTVNGVELRPAPGKSYRGVFTDPALNWSSCLAR